MAYVAVRSKKRKKEVLLLNLLRNILLEVFLRKVTYCRGSL